MPTATKTIKKKEVTVVIPESVTISVSESNIVTVKGEKGEEKRRIDRNIDVRLESKKMILIAQKKGKRGKTAVGSSSAHIRNIIKGVSDGHIYTLKICSSHFPMTVAVEKDSIVVKNFMGEKVPRIIKAQDNVIVKVTGQDITVESTNKESAGNMAGALERLTSRTAYDRRIFQDGIYIVNKDGKAIS